MDKFKEKTDNPSDVEAIQFDGENYDEVEKFTKGKASKAASTRTFGPTMVLEEGEDAKMVLVDDYIVEDKSGVFFRMSASEFDKNYAQA